VSVQPVGGSATGVGAVLPGPIRQIGYVVRDLRAAIDDALALGIGPWFTMLDLPQEGMVYRGAPCAPVLSIGFANSGDLQVELIQQVDDSPSIYREFLDAGREGFQQLAWWVDDFAAFEARADAAGWQAVYGGDAAGSRFEYYETAGALATIVEVMELTDATKWMASTVRDAAAAWDPMDPEQPAVRPLV
jgi:catechol 2,3-dioxygenase-like lactoylglutathione lyase family enzyme